MKKLLAILTAAALLICGSAIGYAEPDYEPDIEPSNEVYAGQTVVIDGFVDSDGVEAPTPYDTDDYSLRKTFSSGGSYVERCWIDEEEECVKLKIVDVIDSDREEISIKGTLTLRNRENDTNYIVKLRDDHLVLNSYGKDVKMIGSDGDFSMPSGYETNKVRFTTEDDEFKGTFEANFSNDAYFIVRVVDQDDLFLGYHTGELTSVTKKYPNAKGLQFVSWSARPTFDYEGTLGIICDNDEYVYSASTDGTLTLLSGKYNYDEEAFEFKTKTLGSYVISPEKISGTATGAASSAPASSSSAAPSSAPASSSSVASSAPASSSSVASSAPASSSSAASSAPASSSSVAPSSAPAESSSEAPAPSKVEPTKPVVSDEADDGGFPVVPVAIAAAVVVAVVVGVALFGGKKKKFQNWDE